MLWLWYSDRSTGLLAYVLLVMATLTGIPFDAGLMGALNRFSRWSHTPLSWAAVGLVFAHGILGTIDASVVAGGQVPAPGYGIPFLLVGCLVGLGALVLILVATAAFADPKRFHRPWKPRLVHAFAYGGFGLATIHMAAVGTDIKDWGMQIAVAIGALVVLSLLLRVVMLRGHELEKPVTVSRAGRKKIYSRRGRSTPARRGGRMR